MITLYGLVSGGARGYVLIGVYPLSWDLGPGLIDLDVPTGGLKGQSAWGKMLIVFRIIEFGFVR